MAPKIGAPRGNKKAQVAATKVVEKKKTCRRLPNPALATPSRSLATGSRRKKQVSRFVKAGLHFPVGRIGSYLKEGRYSQHIGSGAAVYLATVLKYLTTEVLEIVGQATKDSKKIRIIPRDVMLDVMLGIMRDGELSKLLTVVTITHSDVLPSIHESLLGDGTTEDAAKLLVEDAAKSPEKTMESP